MKRLLTTIAGVALLLGVFAGPASAAGGSFGLESVSTWLRTPAGAPQLEAGAHPSFNTTFALEPSTDEAGGKWVVNPKDVEVTLPPGLVGNPQALPTCSQLDFYVLVRQANCDPASQVGIAKITFYLHGSPFSSEVALYNLAPPNGVAAQFAFDILGVPVYIDATVTPEGDYRLRAVSGETSQALDIAGTSVTLWGVPASHAYDHMRTPKGGFGPTGEVVPGAAVERPFMSNPTSCPGTALTVAFRADSWRAPGAFSEKSVQADAEGNPLVLTDCGRVPFDASMTVQPTTTQAESPTGLDVDVEMPQTELPEGLRSSDLRQAVVTLPEGMTINPASAGGLGSCSTEQIGLGSNAEPTCPQSSRIGSLQVKSPLLEEQLTGSVFLAQQGKNKFGSLVALYLVIEDPARGVLVKIAGRIELDPNSGRLVARFEDTPQLPVTTLQLTFFGGPRAALMTPPTCGTYSTRGEFGPWSGGATVTTTDSFRVTSGPEGAPCPSNGFDPRLEAGTANPAAGRFNPLEVRIARADGTQRLGSVTVGLPKGLLAKLAGVPYCPDAALGSIPAAEGAGAAELSTPACPSASRVGTVTVAAGAGSSPFWEKTGSAYLAGPYKGAPLSLAVVTPAVAGPFDLGNVVIRTALQVNPETAAVTAISDPLPTILHGIPLDLRDVRVTLDRGEFTRNPTSCEPTAITSTIASVTGTQAHPQSRFQAAGCAGLPFHPKLSLRVLGKTNRNAKPRFRAVLTAAPGEAGIGRAQVNLPHSLFLEQGHLQTICTRVQWNAGAGHGSECPAGTVYGWARAFTPLLEKPLEGPVYLRSSSHKLPDLVAALNGQIDIELDAKVDAGPNKGLRTTFESVPDAPVSKFVLTMKGGKKGILVNSENLCSKQGRSGRAIARFTGQNGKVESLKTKVAAKCRPTKAG